MYTFIVTLIVVASLLMCFIVLIQKSKGGGLSSDFSSSNQIMGVRKTTDLIEKSTWGLAIIMVVLSVVSAYVIPPASTSVLDNTIMNTNSAPTMPVQQNLPGQAAPAQGAAGNATAPAQSAPAQQQPTTPQAPAANQ